VVDLLEKAKELKTLTSKNAFCWRVPQKPAQHEYLNEHHHHTLQSWFIVLGKLAGLDLHNPEKKHH